MTIGNMINTVLLIAVLSVLSFDYISKVELRTDQRQLIQETLSSLND